MWRTTTRTDWPGRRNRCAYTLIEMLIASVLVAALMSVVYGMMSMYNSYLTAGQSQAVEQQLIRSVFQLLEQDLLNVAISDTNPKITPAMDVVGEFSLATNDITGLVTDPFAMSPSESVDDPLLFSGSGATDIAEPPGRISFAGNSSSFRLSIERLPPEESSSVSQSGLPPGQVSGEPGADSRPQPEMVNELQSTDATMAIEGMAPVVPEFQTVIWQFQAPGVIASESQSLRSGLYRIQTDSLALQTALRQQTSLLEDSVPDDGASVDQMTMEALLFPPVDTRSQTMPVEANGSENTAAVPQFDVIPEVVACRLEYFSGSGWSSSWNSDQQNGLPVAVRVRLRLVTPRNLERLNQVFGTTSSQGTLLENALGDPAGVTKSPTASNAQLPEEAGADPFRMIPTRQVERIILLQPITGPMPQPGAGEESNALPGGPAS